MAISNGVNYAAALDDEKLATTENHGRVRVCIDQATFPSTAANGDIHRIGWIPAGARILSVTIINLEASAGTSATLFVEPGGGAANDAGRFYGAVFSSGFTQGVAVTIPGAIATSAIGPTPATFPSRLRMPDSGPIDIRYSTIASASNYNSKTFAYIIHYVLD